MHRSRLAWLICVLMTALGTAHASDRYDGNWTTKLTCPPKQMTEGYTWRFPSVIKDAHFRGERGKPGEPGYFLLEGNITEDGSATLAGNGIVLDRKYAKGIFAAKGENYGYDVKAQFRETVGTGIKGEGLGIVGRACTFDFVKDAAAPASGQP